MQGFSAASIHSEALVEGKIYAMLLFACNAWGYGVFNGAAGFRLSDTQTIPLDYRQTHFNYRRVHMWMARMGPNEYDVHPVQFYPITHSVETMVHTWREARRLQEWEEDGVGDWKITPLNRMGWTLMEHLRTQAWARRKDAVMAWAAVLAAAGED